MTERYPQFATRVFTTPSITGELFGFELRTTDDRVFVLPDTVVDLVNGFGETLECEVRYNADEDYHIMVVLGPEEPIKFMDWLISHSTNGYDFVHIYKENAE